MLTFRQIALLGLVLCFGTNALFAQAPPEGNLAKQVARLPWDMGEVGVWLNDSAHSSQIVVLGHYVNPHAFDFTDRSYIHVYAKKGS
jgi:hypothetical protein